MNLARIAAEPVPRRGFLALGGGTLAAGVLAGCGTEIEEPSTGRDVELLSQAVVGEENAASALQRAEGEASGADGETLRAMREGASEQATAVQAAFDELGESPSGDFGAPDAADPLDAAIEATNQAIAAYRLGAGQFSTEELRQQALTWISADGARLALLQDLLGEEIAPTAFVTGLDQAPLEFPDEDDGDDGDEETTTTTGDSEATTETTSTPEETP